MNRHIEEWIHDITVKAIDNVNKSRGNEQDYHLANAYFMMDMKNEQEDRFARAEIYYNIDSSKRQDELEL